MLVMRLVWGRAQITKELLDQLDGKAPTLTLHRAPALSTHILYVLYGGLQK